MAPIAHWITLGVMLLYLGGTTLLGLWQTRRIKGAKDLVVGHMSSWRAATFLAGFTLGGAATYGMAGDTVKFGLTYLLWFPLSVALGWWVTGMLFARPYYRLQGITLPTLLGQRFGRRTRLACSLSTMLYALFTILLELYALEEVIRSVAPHLAFPQAMLTSLIVAVLSVAFSGMLGVSATNLVHSSVIALAFGVTLIALWPRVGGWEFAVQRTLSMLPTLAPPDMDARHWLSVTGLGWGTVGQLLLGKAGRLGGISSVSSLAASCESESDAAKAFWLAGFLSCVPPFLAGAVGIFTVALTGSHSGNLPTYSSIGLTLIEINPWLAGMLLAAIAAAILSTFGPIALTLASVLIEDIIKQITRPTDKQIRALYPLVIIVASASCAAYATLWGIGDILPFIYTTAFPCTVPSTLVALAAIYCERVNECSASWAIALGVTSALVWEMVLKPPWGIPNIYIAFIVSLLVLVQGALRNKTPTTNAQRWVAKARGH